MVSLEPGRKLTVCKALSPSIAPLQLSAMDTAWHVVHSPQCRNDVQSHTEIRQQVTNPIIASLEFINLPPWRQSWNNDPNAGLNNSLSTGNNYRGINQLLLQLSAFQQNFQSKWWGTFNQVCNCGASIEKGQKATKIVLWKPVSRRRKNEVGKEVDESIFIMKQISVFNAEQTTGLD